MKATKHTLTETQQAILQHAASHPEGLVEWMPEHIKGGAKNMLLKSLATHEYIVQLGEHWFITIKGHTALLLVTEGLPTITPSDPTQLPDIANVTGVRCLQNKSQGLDNTATQNPTVGVCDSTPADNHLTDLAFSPAPAPESMPGIPKTRKQALVVSMLRRQEGATIEQLMRATGWQAHSVRGYLSNIIQQKLGLRLVSQKPLKGVRVYRIEEDNLLDTNVNSDLDNDDKTSTD